MDKENMFEKEMKILEGMIENFNKGIIENSPTVKNGINTPEEELDEPANLIFRYTYETVLELMNNPSVNASFDKLRTQVGEDATKDLALAMIGINTNAAYQAIVFYDNRLRLELVNQFKVIVDQLNKQHSDLKAIHASYRMMLKKVNEIETNIRCEKLAEEANKLGL